ncbi:MAG: hypothetical protein WCI74_00845 [Actinomycetes bacterium]
MASESAVRPANQLVRSVGALAVVWAVSLACSLVHLTSVPATAWCVATIALLPVGITLSDRLIALLLLGSAPAVLIAWISPNLPWLVAPGVLTGLLGTPVAIAYGLGWTKAVVIRVPDWVTLILGAATGAFFAIPYFGGGVARTIGVLSTGYDQGAHYFMWMRVWANHGYLLANTLPDPDAWAWRVYPQGSQAILADLGTVITGSSAPPTAVGTSVQLFAALVTVQAAMLAVVTAWSVDRLCRTKRQLGHLRQQRVVILQIVAVLLVAIGPGSMVATQSLSFTVGVVVIIPAMALAATATRSPRRDGILVAASLIAAAAVYPVCALLGVILWPLYLWTSRGFWLASRRRRWYAVAWTVATAIACSPMFVLIARRNLDHNWETAGYFQNPEGLVYAGVAISLVALILVGHRRSDKPVQYAYWVSAIALVVLGAQGIREWRSVGDLSYYTVKTMYLAWMLAVIAVCAGLASLRDQKNPATAQPRSRLRKVATYGVVAALLIVSLLTELSLARLSQYDTNAGWQAISKQGWVWTRASSLQEFGDLIVRSADYTRSHNGVSVLTPCFSRDDRLASNYLAYLTGGMNQVEVDVVMAACRLSRDGPLGTLPAYLQAHPEVTVNAIAIDQDSYEWALAEKESNRLSNLTVVPPLDSGTAPTSP